MSAIAWMLSPPTPPQEWPADACHHNGLYTADDDVPYSEADLAHGISPEAARKRGPVLAQLEETKARLAQAAAALPPPRVKDRKAETIRQRELREAAAAERGEFFLPLEPGQKRRRRAGPDGKPLKRGGAGKRGGASYVRAPQRLAALQAGAPIVYRGPQRAPGEMTYGQAARLVQRANDGELVDMHDLQRAHNTLEAARLAKAAS